jgi:Cof subfamily protein (haloacid dehalogenase superfamily)
MARDRMSGDTLPPLRLLVSDVDGTLVRHDKSLSDATIAAAHRFVEAGGAMTLISARPPSGILPLAERLGLIHKIGAFNGGTVVTMDGEIVVAHRLDAETSRTGIAAILDAGITCWVFADGNWYASDDTNPHIDREIRSAMVDPIFTRDFAALHGRIDKFVGVTDDQAEIAELEAALKVALGDKANVALSQTYYCDVTHPLANKGDGIGAIAEAIGVPLSETAAIGDMPNDLPMLTRAAFPIAMGQAPEVVKQAAKAVTESNEDDGVAAAIDRYLIPALPR